MNNINTTLISINNYDSNDEDTVLEKNLRVKSFVGFC